MRYAGPVFWGEASSWQDALRDAWLAFWQWIGGWSMIGPAIITVFILMIILASDARDRRGNSRRRR
jgi:hypothetical protein